MKLCGFLILYIAADFFNVLVYKTDQHSLTMVRWKVIFESYAYCILLAFNLRKKINNKA